ncbi:hypothetical protein ACJU26_11010 [Acidithiobacillus sp. M4-SHS-6]|uniref:hypothetical protein n=1 Tax=Acidithiobacillus sp. M4-SHS-6 TaxID=3383024 RepID=UPI0039BDB05A
MKFISSVYGKRELEGRPDDYAILDILDALESQHDLVNEKWEALMGELDALNVEEALDSRARITMSDRRLLLEQELSRYQRFFRVLRQSLVRTKSCFP